MNEEQIYEVLNLQFQFSNDLMDLNIKYGEEIERLKNIINEAREYIDNCGCDDKAIFYIENILDKVVEKEQDENNSIIK